MNKGYNVAVVGATGAVGRTIIDILEQRAFPIDELRLFASERSRGTKIPFKGASISLDTVSQGAFNNIDLVFFSAGGTVSKAFVPQAVQEGAVVIDNTSVYRLHPDVPLVVPEVNEDELCRHQGIIANPNCSTIQMVAALKPISDAFGLKRVIVSTYQSVSGAGSKAVFELETSVQDYLEVGLSTSQKSPLDEPLNQKNIAFNVIPQIDVFREGGYTFEELKMINETKKLLRMPQLAVAATCVRVPVVTSHAESVYIEIDSDNISVGDIKHVMREGKGIVIEDDPNSNVYPTPLSAAQKDDVFVGRIRKDFDHNNGFHMWIVSDNLRKGAALNSVQIAESLVSKSWI
ncbi:aspartate-semialdehyde dehydrogenase [Lentibacillus saliphilus]|uniref:aspartate-semialdehyde dehydrogenase n=1 Tax=Lentibacillus saliphilus TaxID=2737028 RepID=UPI001C2F5AD1|nr:aspartate-semialdehyde dehydrogenase [Lentibacillus saliphilus]